MNTEKSPLVVYGSMSIYTDCKKRKEKGPIQIQHRRPDSPFKAEFNQKLGLCMVKKEKLTIGNQEYF